MVCGAADDGLTAFDVGVTDGVDGTDALVTAGLVFADGSGRARVVFLAKLQRAALAVRKKLVAMRTNAEAGSVTSVNTLFVGRARVVGAAVLTLHEAVVIVAEEGRWAAASVTVQADEISGAVVSDATLSDRQTHFVGVAFEARRTRAGGFVVLGFANRVGATLVFEIALHRARVVALTSSFVAFLRCRAFVIANATRRLASQFVTAALVGIAFEAHRADTFVRSDQIVTLSMLGAGIFPTFINVFALMISVESETARADTQAVIVIGVKTFLVTRTRIVSRAVCTRTYITRKKH